jgi:hypothetical protein
MRGILKLYLIGRDRYDAFEATRTFSNKMFAHHGSEALKASTRNRLLEQIEGEFFETFVKVYKKYLKLGEILHEFKGGLVLLLRKCVHEEYLHLQKLSVDQLRSPVTISMNFLNP